MTLTIELTNVNLEKKLWISYMQIKLDYLGQLLKEIYLLKLWILI